MVWNNPVEIHAIRAQLDAKEIVYAATSSRERRSGASRDASRACIIYCTCLKFAVSKTRTSAAPARRFDNERRRAVNHPALFPKEISTLSLRRSPRNRGISAAGYDPLKRISRRNPIRSAMHFLGVLHHAALAYDLRYTPGTTFIALFPCAASGAQCTYRTEVKQQRLRDSRGQRGEEGLGGGRRGDARLVGKRRACHFCPVKTSGLSTISRAAACVRACVRGNRPRARAKTDLG